MKLERRGRREGQGAASLGLACGREAGSARAAAAGCDWPQFSACCRRAGEAWGARTEPGGGFPSRGGGAGAVAAEAGAGTEPGGMSEVEAAAVATAAPAATVPATAAGVVAVVVPVPAGEPQKAGGGAGCGGVGAASGSAAGTPSAPGPRNPGNLATAASGTPAPPARSQAEKPVLGEGGTRARAVLRGLGGLGEGHRGAGRGKVKGGPGPETQWTNWAWGAVDQSRFPWWEILPGR